MNHQSAAGADIVHVSLESDSNGRHAYVDVVGFAALLAYRSRSGLQHGGPSSTTWSESQITLYSGWRSPEANRSMRKASTSTVCAFPSTISSAMSSPATGPCMNPWPENPAMT